MNAPVQYAEKSSPAKLLAASTTPTNNVPKRKTFGVLSVLALCVLFTAAMKGLTYSEPIRGDQGIYAVIGHEMLQGRQLYSDLWDHKPPGIHVAYALAELVAGYGPQQLYLLNMVGLVSILIGLYWAGTLLGGQAAGLGAAVLFALASAFPHWEGYQPNTELWVNAFLVWSFCILYRLNTTPAWWRAVVFGAMIGLASLFKHVAVAHAVLFGVVYILASLYDPKRRWLGLRHMIVAGAVSTTFWVGCGLWFWLHGTFGAFYDAVFVYNRAYSGNLVNNLLESRHLYYKSYLVALLIPCMLVALAAPRLNSAQRTGWFLLGAWAVGCHVAIALAARWVEYYYELWMPVYALAGGAMVVGLFLRVIERPRLLRWALLAMIFMPLGIRLVQRNQYGSAHWLTYNTGSLEYRFRHDPPQAAQAVDRVLKPGERLYALGAPGEGPPLLFYTRQHPASGIFYDFPLYPHRPFPTKLEDRLVGDLDRNPPDLIAWSKESGPRTADAEPNGWGQRLSQWLSEHYSRCNVPEAPGRYQFFARRGSAIENRLHQIAQLTPRKN